jgi:predicted RNA-binding protein YlxR (DUF448 family)
MTIDKKKKGAKSHHMSTRMCVACGKRSASVHLLRYIRTESGRLELDRKHRKGGRGAYICGSKSCFENALLRSLFNRALRGKVSFDRNRMLSEFEG